MAGIYIHIPFCENKCHYCNFFSVATKKYRKETIEAIVKEIQLRRNYTGNEEIETIYYGGGTPTVLNTVELQKIQRTIYKNFDVKKDAEVSIEANPDDLNAEKLHQLRDSGFNRLSIGIQAFDDNILEKLNRRHSAIQSLEAVLEAQKAGFDNISIDLIYGIPNLTDEKWKKTLDEAVSLNINHISAYHLTVEPGTALEVLIRKKKYQPPDEKAGVSQFLILTERLSQAGFEQYEISNFAKEGRYSKHNTNYWLSKKYIGIGPSAHSFDLKSRRWNIGAVKAYFENIFKGTPAFETEILTKSDRYNEYVMLSLRTKWGVDIHHIESAFGEQHKNDFEAVASEKIKEGKMLKKAGIYALTSKGKLFADAVAADFFI